MNFNYKHCLISFSSSSLNTNNSRIQKHAHIVLSLAKARLFDLFVPNLNIIQQKLALLLT